MKFIIYLSFCSMFFAGNSQQPFSPHIVFDKNNNDYAVKISSKYFLKVVDSAGAFQFGYPNDEQGYWKAKGFHIIKVSLGKETMFSSKEQAQALLEYWRFFESIKPAPRKKPNYTD